MSSYSLKTTTVVARRLFALYEAIPPRNNILFRSRFNYTALRIVNIHLRVKLFDVNTVVPNE